MAVFSSDSSKASSEENVKVQGYGNEESSKSRLIAIGDLLVVHVKRHVRRDLSANDQRKGRTNFFKLCVVKKNGKCVRKKTFGMWNASSGPDSLN